MPVSPLVGEIIIILCLHGSNTVSNCQVLEIWAEFSGKLFSRFSQKVSRIFRWKFYQSKALDEIFRLVPSKGGGTYYSFLHSQTLGIFPVCHGLSQSNPKPYCSIPACFENPPGHQIQRQRLTISYPALPKLTRVPDHNRWGFLKLMLPTITRYKGCIGGQFLPSTQGIVFPIHRDEGQRLDVQQNSFIGMWSMYLCFTISDLACCQDTYDTISWWRRGWHLLLAQEMDPRIQKKEGKGGAVQRNWSMWMCCPLFHKIVVDSACDHDFANVTRNGCIGGRFLPPTQGIVLPIHRDGGKRYVVQQNLFIWMWNMYLCLTFSELACCQDTYATFTWCSGGWFLPLTEGMDSPVHRIEDWGHAMYVMSIMGVSYMFCYSQSVCPHPLLPRSFTMDVVVVMEDTAGRPPEHHRYTYSWRLWPNYVRKVNYESVLRVFVTH